MAAPQESVSMALFCDFENVALGVRGAKDEKFEIRPVLERLLLKGSIVVKKAYCDWERYKGFKAAMHEANFELIEIPHVRQSGKNSADIRLVVDALDLCYTKSHVDTFVILSGDSDFSPLVSKLRENAKKVIGVGVRQSTSDLLVANCDEFIFYDDLVRDQQRAIAKRDTREPKPAAGDDRQPKRETEARRSQAIAVAVETFEALVSERGESGKIWASVLKSAIKRRKPGFSETQYGFKAFGNLLDEAQARGLLEVGRDDKSGAFVFRSAATAASDIARTVTPLPPKESDSAEHGNREAAPPQASEPAGIAEESTLNEPKEPKEPNEPNEPNEPRDSKEPKKQRTAAPRRARKTTPKQASPVEPQAPPPAAAEASTAQSQAAKPSRTSASRAGRSRKRAENPSDQ